MGRTPFTRCHENDVTSLFDGIQVNVTSLDDVTVVLVGCIKTAVIKMFIHV